MKKRILFLFLLLWIISLENTYAQEEVIENPVFTDRFLFGVGVYIPIQNVSFGANGVSQDEEIDFDETFNFNNNDIRPTFFFKWRFAKRWLLVAEYFNIQNSQKGVLEEDITWDEYVLKKGSSVTGGFKTDLLRVYVGWNFFQGLKQQVGAGLGVHGINLGPFIEGDVYINDEEYNFQKISLSLILPVPNIGIWYVYTPNTKWAFNTGIDWFGIELGKYSVSLWDISAGVNYQFFKHIGMGLNYRFFNIKGDVNNENWNGTFNLSFQGPTIGITGNF